MMKLKTFAFCAISVAVSGCATPPAANPALVDSQCAQSCSANLATCSSGFKFFPVVQQKQCNDTYDVCIKGCPARQGTIIPAANQSVEDRLKHLGALYKAGGITQSEYETKRKEILSGI